MKAPASIRSHLIKEVPGIFLWSSIPITIIMVFDPELYLLLNPDVKRAGVDPVKHYKNYGKREGRQTHPAGNNPKEWTYKSITDPEFYNHFLWCTDICEKWIGSSKRVLDFGCGVDITGLGLSLRYNHEIVGVDISPMINYLPFIAKQQIGLEYLPNNLSLHHIQEGSNLQDFGFFDAIIAWSVFEHVDLQYMTRIIRNFKNILKPDGVVFIQIEPMWLSPFGSHLQLFLKEPWAHLLHDRASIRSMVYSALSPQNFQLSLGNTQTWDQAKDSQLIEFDKLNRIRIDDIIKMFSEEGFQIVREEKNQVPTDPPYSLKIEYSEEDLKTNEVLLLFRCCK
jgi:SAM-dependent methyltransferase